MRNQNWEIFVYWILWEWFGRRFVGNAKIYSFAHPNVHTNFGVSVVVQILLGHHRELRPDLSSTALPIAGYRFECRVI